MTGYEPKKDRDSMTTITDATPQTRPALSDLLAELTPGQRRVAEAFVSGDVARSYRAVAADLEIHVGTLYTHLRRIRMAHAAVYWSLMELRATQLQTRHEAAIARAQAHSQRWQGKQASRRYRLKFGRFRWEGPR